MTGLPTTSTAARIADLIAWARLLTETGHPGDPAEHAAYQTAKADLLAYLTDPYPTTGAPADGHPTSKDQP